MSQGRGKGERRLARRTLAKADGHSDTHDREPSPPESRIESNLPSSGVLDSLPEAIAENVVACELIDEWRATAHSTNIEELKKNLRESLRQRLDVLRQHPACEVNDMLLHQYDQSLLERRNLDSLGWTVYGGAFAVSLTLLAFCVSGAVTALPAWTRAMLVLIPYGIHSFGYSILRKIRVSRHIHRAIATAIEEELGLFHLTVSKITNRPLRTAHDAVLLWVSRVYLFVTIVLVIVQAYGVPAVNPP